MNYRLSAALSVTLLTCSSVGAVRAQSDFETKVAPVLKTYCVSCHGGTRPKAELGLDRLAADFDKHGETWKGVMDRIGDGSMPPNGKARPTAAEARIVTAWVARELTAHQTKKAASIGRARLRRLNRVEYANTVRDLLGVDVDIEALPEDGIASGFDNVDNALDLSTTLLERYLETADAALEAAMNKGEKPRTTSRHIDYAPIGKQLTKAMRPIPRFGFSTRVLDSEVHFFGANDVAKPLIETRAGRAGLYRIRLSANTLRHGKPMPLLFYAGNYGKGVQGLMTRPLSVHDVPEKPAVIEFTERLSADESLRIFAFGLPNLYAKVADNYAGAGLAVRWIEMEGPLVDVWPPPLTTRLLAGVDLSKATLADAETILQQFAPRAFRRPLQEKELAPYLHLVKTRLDKGYTLEAALRVGLKAVLCSPQFLYVSASPGKLSDFELATRLSYFLWSTMPDDALTNLAVKKELSKPEVLREQVERMLKDARAQAFTENFTGQWLSLRNLKATIPDKKLYPDFDELLELSMPRETHLFFDEILKGDRSVLEFVHSDWSMLNERLAVHYGIPDVQGSQFRKVKLPPGSHRGGVMTHASVLRVTANGTNTSPVTRGTWVLDRILGTPAPPPPQDVPAIEPDIRGAKTLREQLAKHRQIESCAGCHSKIDPAGNALENFDVIGGWREYYRVVPGKGFKQVKITSPMHARFGGVGRGPVVQAGDEMPGGRKFADIDGFKKIILENPDQLARGLTQRMLVYATGHGIEFADREVVESILKEVRAREYGLRTLIHAIVQSPTFRSK